MKSKLLTFLLFIGSVFIANSIRAQNKPTDKQAIGMLIEFYSAYITVIADSKSPADLKELEALSKKYCTTGLLRKINAQYVSGRMDSDFFTHTQDASLSMLKSMAFSKDVKRLNGYTLYFSDSYNKHIIHLTVTKQGGKYKISDVY
ncbi:hypothetical protein GCM10023185_09370 [Hymenobacter saemangeumensis]|uniref:DUF3828 domain-containing protein n=1 Tax=Hymenobacter saemangeumensis TaxID=1084522 RepID=A0ABP8I4I5_9BACT